MAKRVLISRPEGTKSERQAADEVDFEMRMRQTGRTPTYTPTQETLNTRDKIRNYKPISQLSPEELRELRIKYHNQ